VVVVVPETTTERAKALIRQEGAELVVHGTSWHEANALARSMVGQSDAFLHPFDDPLIWRGHASLVDEVVRSGVRPDVVVLSVGGGGLLSGIIEGLHRNAWTGIPVVAVETEGADSLGRSIRAGYRVVLPEITSIATSLGATQFCERAFRWVGEHPLRSIVVSDRAAVSACRKFLDDHRLVVEPACGASLSVLYDRAPVLEEFETVLVVVCGGVTATVAKLREWADELA
jgi:L-serine/L-threonine ammonia-lyase